ncbi:MAG: HPr family phosphocarrier protein, partial [SAR324 cluster bacterium]|nr:HPr family phosphocarrier protein [SAR324 cluster bacterium]
MTNSTTKIINRLGLHARAAALLVKLSNSYQSEI